jgi:hypothetical protein
MLENISFTLLFTFFLQKWKFNLLVVYQLIRQCNCESQSPIQIYSTLSSTSHKIVEVEEVFAKRNKSLQSKQQIGGGSEGL